MIPLLTDKIFHDLPPRIFLDPPPPTPNPNPEEYSNSFKEDGLIWVNSREFTVYNRTVMTMSNDQILTPERNIHIVEK